MGFSFGLLVAAIYFPVEKEFAVIESPTVDLSIPETENNKATKKQKDILYKKSSKNIAFNKEMASSMFGEWVHYFF